MVIVLVISKVYIFLECGQYKRLKDFDDRRQEINSFPAFGIGTIFPVFHISELVRVLMLKLKVSASYGAPFSPICLIIAVARPSVPMAVEFIPDLMNRNTSSAVKSAMSTSIGRVFILLLMRLIF